jgi:hypothetical protein
VSIVILRYALFPSASHINFSFDAVEVRLGMIGCPSWNLTNIPLEFTKAHHKTLDRTFDFALAFLSGFGKMFWFICAAISQYLEIGFT